MKIYKITEILKSLQKEEKTAFNCGKRFWKIKGEK